MAFAVCISHFNIQPSSSCHCSVSVCVVNRSCYSSSRSEVSHKWTLVKVRYQCGVPGPEMCDASNDEYNNGPQATEMKFLSLWRITMTRLTHEQSSPHEVADLMHRLYEAVNGTTNVCAPRDRKMYRQLYKILLKVAFWILFFISK